MTANLIPVTSEALQSLMETFQPLIAKLALALIDVDGSVLATVGNPPLAHVPSLLREVANGTQAENAIETAGGRAYALFADDQWAGMLWSHGIDADAPRIERALARSVSLFLTQTAIAADQLDVLKAAQTRTRQLEVIMEITQELSSTLDLEKLLKLIMSSAVHILGAGSGSLFLVDDTTGDLVFRVVTSGEEELIGTRVPFGKGIIGQVASTGESIICIDVENDERFFGKLDHSGFVTRSLMAVPLRVPHRLIGVLELINKIDGTDFVEEDRVLLTAFAAQAAIAIENARLYQDAIAKQRLEHELHLAYKVQSSLIPLKTPKLEGWEFAAWWQPAREVSGDYYDFIHKGDCLGTVVADVSDKGMHAALMMALTRSVVRATTLSSLTPQESLTQANRLVCADATGGMFVTLFYGEIDPAANRLTYVNCGHNPPYWYRAAEKSLIELKRTALVMGFDDQIVCEQREIEIGAGDLVVLYTDGVTEAFSPHREQFGEERLSEIITSHAGESPDQVLAVIQNALNAFTEDTPQSDDITIMIVKRL